MRRNGGSTSSPPRPCRGFAIILVLATLVLLAMLSYIFIKQALIDRNIARNYMDNKRAKLISQSGVEYAIGRLNTIIQQGWFKNGKLTNTEWFYDKETKTPSFADPREIIINGQTQRFSSLMTSSTYGQNSDIFRLKVIDTQGQININDGAKLGAGHQVSMNLARILNELGRIVSIDQSKLKDPTKGLGENIMENRPPQGYTSKEELRKIVNQDEIEFDKFRDFITTHSWSNDKVAVPVPLADNDQVKGVYNTIMPGLFDSYIRPIDSSKYYDVNGNVISDNAGKKIYRYGHNRNYKGDVIARDTNTDLNSKTLGELYFFDGLTANEYYKEKFYNAVFSYDALNPQWIELTSRCPVNINTAAKKVLLSLIIGLEGWFVSSRRAPNPLFGSSKYYDLPYKYTYDKSTWGRESFGASADEIGFIYTTIPYKKTGTTEFIDFINAEKIVDEIIYSRKRESSPVTGVNYANEGFGGPFRSWAQFNAFVDRLVQEQIIKDSRNIYKDLVNNGTLWFTTPGGNTYAPVTYTDPPPVTVIDSPAQKRVASQAIADVLKANFNPNLHLNELNPDQNLYLTVDKTDLIVNSTEFCFTPMGVFEIESEGFVLKPDTGDALTASDSKIISQAGIRAIVRLYDALYHTTQKDFYGPDPYCSFSTITVSPTTNNNYAVETGPEVDNGVATEKTEYDGYIRLATNLGCFSGPNYKDKGRLYTTYTGTSTEYATIVNKAPAGTGSISTEPGSYNARIHSHFQLDHVAHYHPNGADATLPIGTEVKYQAGLISNPPLPSQLDTWTFNFPDKTETRKGPYSPVDNSSARYRLCNSYRLDSLTPPDRSKYAPEDLRVDGVYTEPHSAFGYDNIDFFSNAVMSLWLKPNWYPEVTNRVKTVLTMRSYFKQWTNEYLLEWPMPFDVLYYPVNPATINEASQNRAILFSCLADEEIVVSEDELGNKELEDFAGYGWSTILNHEFETTDESLNRFRGNCSATTSRFNRLRSHVWSHVIVRFSEEEDTSSGGPGSSWNWPFETNSVYISIPGEPGVKVQPKIETYVNGKLLGSYSWYKINGGPSSMGFPFSMGTIRIGGDYSSYCAVDLVDDVDTQTPAHDGELNRIFYSDSTLDEFFFWADNSTAVTYATDIWEAGRYYRPDDSNSDDAVYTSVAIDLNSQAQKSPSETAISDPSGSGSSSSANFSNQMKIIGLSWTYYAENYGPSWEFPTLQGTYPDGTPRLKPVMIDWKMLGTIEHPTETDITNAILPISDSDALCLLYLTKGPADPYGNDEYSVADVTVGPGETFSYKIKFRTGTVNPDTVLLASPVFDDITIYYTCPVRYVAFTYFE